MWLVIFYLIGRDSCRDAFMCGGGLGLEFWLMVFSFEADSIRREDIIYGFSPWRGFALTWCVYLMSAVFISFALDNCLMKIYNKETQEDK